MAAAHCIALIDCPPSAKKSSVTPRSSVSRTRFQMARREDSTSFRAPSRTVCALSRGIFRTRPLPPPVP